MQGHRQRLQYPIWLVLFYYLWFILIKGIMQDFPLKKKCIDSYKSNPCVAVYLSAETIPSVCTVSSSYFAAFMTFLHCNLWAVGVWPRSQSQRPGCEGLYKNMETRLHHWLRLSLLTLSVSWMYKDLWSVCLTEGCTEVWVCLFVLQNETAAK